MARFSSPQNPDTVCFTDRREAGEQLAQAVLNELTQTQAQDASSDNVCSCVVYALPRGGLPIAAPVAHLLGCPLDLVVAKKITRPDNSELAIGAVTSDGHVVWAPSRRSVTITEASPNNLPSDHPLNQQHHTALEKAQAHAQRQLLELTAASSRYSPQGAIAIVVDDGIATGMTMAAAVQALRTQHPAQIWICAPVAPQELMPFLSSISDQVIVLATPHPFYSVSRFYKDFPQVSTQEAAIYLEQNLDQHK